MNDQPALSFERDIRPLFTAIDVQHMKPMGIDLSSRDDVAAHADAIYATVKAGTMPPASSGEPRWTEATCVRFKDWQTQGCPP
jgi:hypothetical protein